MKTTFKKTMAIISASAMVAASAAVFAVPANAAGEVPGTLTIGTVELTLDELKAADYTVTVPVTLTGSSGFLGLGFGVGYNVNEVTVSKSAIGMEVMMAAAGEGCQVVAPAGINNDMGITWVGMGTIGVGDMRYYCPGGNVVNFTFKVNEGAKPGDVYTLTNLADSGKEVHSIYLDPSMAEYQCSLVLSSSRVKQQLQLQQLQQQQLQQQQLQQLQQLQKSQQQLQQHLQQLQKSQQQHQQLKQQQLQKSQQQHQLQQQQLLRQQQLLSRQVAQHLHLRQVMFCL